MIQNTTHTNNKKTISYKTKQRIFYYCLIIIPIVQFLIFYIGVNFNSIILAFKSYDVYTGENTFNGFGNFSQLFKDFSEKIIFRYAFKNSFIRYFSTLVVGVFGALLFSYYIFKKYLCSGLFQIILFLPSIISSLAFVLMYKYMAESAIPYVWQELFDIKIEGLLSNVNTKFGTILFYNLWTCFGVNVIMYSSSMANISSSIIEAAQMDGVNAWQEFYRIVLPRVYSTVVVFVVSGISALFVHQMSLMDFEGAYAEDSLNTVGYYLYAIMTRSSTSVGLYPYLAAFGLFLTLITAPLSIGLKYLLEKVGPKDE